MFWLTSGTRGSDGSAATAAAASRRLHCGRSDRPRSIAVRAAATWRSGFAALPCAGPGQQPQRRDGDDRGRGADHTSDDPRPEGPAAEHLVGRFHPIGQDAQGGGRRPVAFLIPGVFVDVNPRRWDVAEDAVRRPVDPIQPGQGRLSRRHAARRAGKAPHPSSTGTAAVTASRVAPRLIRLRMLTANAASSRIVVALGASAGPSKTSNCRSWSRRRRRRRLTRRCRSRTNDGRSVALSHRELTCRRSIAAPTESADPTF